MMSCPTRRISQRVQPWELDCLLNDGTRGTRWTRTQETSITMSTCNWGISMVCKTMGSRICATTGMSSTSGERNDFLNEQELWENDGLIHNLHVTTCTTTQQGHQPRVNELGNLYDPTDSQDPGKLPLRHDGEMNDLWNHTTCTTGTSTTLSSNWGISMVCETMGSASA